MHKEGKVVEYYGSLISVEKIDGKSEIALNIFPKKFLEIYTETDFWNNGLGEDVPSSYVEIIIDDRLRVDSELINLPSKFKKYQWFEIELTEDEGIPVQFYKSIVSIQNIRRRLKRIQFIDGRTIFARKIKKAFFINKRESTISEIQKVLEDLEISFLAVYDVGQGSCNAFCDSDGMPQLYFDLGGGYKRNATTYPTSLSLCSHSKPPVILSHWDGDHWKSARKFQQFAKYIWIVPRQIVTHDALKLAIEINRQGTLLIWPKAIQDCDVSFGKIIKCSGDIKDINNSGLATIFIQEDENEEDKLYKTLLPGDANYNNIPLINSFKFNNLIVTHHGGINPGNVPSPKNVDNNCHVYSYGQGNSHEHPFKTTISEHDNAGWINKLETINKHIAIGRNLQLNQINKHHKSTTCFCNTVIVQKN